MRQFEAQQARASANLGANSVPLYLGFFLNINVVMFYYVERKPFDAIPSQIHFKLHSSILSYGVFLGMYQKTGLQFFCDFTLPISVKSR